MSAKKELELWRQGVVSWEELEQRTCRQLSLFGSRLSDSLLAAREAVRERNARFFADRLPRREHYRIALAFPDDTLFLDIETTGLSRYYDKITLIGWSFAATYGVFVQGGDLAPLEQALQRAKALVTFNGSLFDLPFIRSELSHLRLPRTHVDLRFFGRRAGLSGPQKTIEAQLGVERDEDLHEIDGKAAVVLWHRYRRGDLDALKRLIRYNHADIEGMKTIFDAAVSRLFLQEGFPNAVQSSVRFSTRPSTITWSDQSGSSRSSGIHIKKYRGNTGPAISYPELIASAPRKTLRAVGIDLTGSEARPSGWCNLVGHCATTAQLSSDDDLFEQTVRAKPHLVSIDSPLSLPSGRTRATDDDPVRDQFGITRLCERILRGRGVSVYPCLIPSMQKLTMRGIRLAERLRKAGVPVLESYPGAAQDIIGIPRKGTSLDLLESGLVDFGITGPWTKKRVSHDELDAITSALVGVFFWCDRFEALGNEEEEYLIIPDLKCDPGKRQSRHVVGVSGPIAAGKTSVARILEKRGYAYGRYSQVLAALLEERGEKPGRESLQRLGAEVHVSPGQRWLCKKLLARMPDECNLVIDGLRHPQDHAFLVETFGPAFKHVTVEAPVQQRAGRYQALGHPREAFDAANAHEVEANVPRLSALAHTHLDNAGRLEQLPGEVHKAARRSPRRKG